MVGGLGTRYKGDKAHSALWRLHIVQPELSIARISLEENLFPNIQIVILICGWCSELQEPRGSSHGLEDNLDLFGVY